MFTTDEASLFVTVFLTLVLAGTSIVVLYWAATIENNIENNPGK